MRSCKKKLYPTPDIDNIYLAIHLGAIQIDDRSVSGPGLWHGSTNDMNILTRRLNYTYSKPLYIVDIPLETGQEFLEQQKRIKALRVPITQKTVAELRSYPKPPQIVKDVMLATLIVLGEEERKVTEVRQEQTMTVTSVYTQTLNVKETVIMVPTLPGKPWKPGILSFTFPGLENAWNLLKSGKNLEL